MQNPTRVGLTGGVGSGKSTLGQMLQELGAALVDADALAREVTGTDGAAIEMIKAQFGPAYIDATGALDRSRMRHLAFTQTHARAQLETIVHPLVSLLSEQRAQEAILQGSFLIVFEIPLLAESRRWTRKLDAILVVDCSEEVQIQRVVERSSLARPTIQSIIAAQATRTERRAVADMVIHNDGDASLADLRSQALQIAHLFGL